MTTDELVRPPSSARPARWRPSIPTRSGRRVRVKIDPYPDGQRFKTPSGKLEFYSETLAAQGLPPMPDWQRGSPRRRRSAGAGRCASSPRPATSRATRPSRGTLRSGGARASPIVRAAPGRRRAARGLRADDGVELFNERGRVAMRLRVSDEVSPGVALVPGQRPAGEAVSGTINLLCGDRLSRSRRGRDLPEHLPRRPPPRGPTGLIPCAGSGR